MSPFNKQDIDRIYDLVLHSANTTLRSCKLFSIEILKLEDPSYSEIARQLKELCDILDQLGTEDPELKLAKAREYADHIRLIAAAIETGDEETLNRHVQELDRRSFL